MGSLGAVKPFHSHSASIAPESSAQGHARLRSSADHHSLRTRPANHGVNRPTQLGILEVSGRTSAASAVWQKGLRPQKGGGPCQSWIVLLQSVARAISGGSERSPRRSQPPPRCFAASRPSTLACSNLRCGSVALGRSKRCSPGFFIRSEPRKTTRSGGGYRGASPERITQFTVVLGGASACRSRQVRLLSRVPPS